MLSRYVWCVLYALDVAYISQEIKVTQDFLKVLNGQVASQMSLLLYVLIQTSIFCKLNHCKQMHILYHHSLESTYLLLNFIVDSTVGYEITDVGSGAKPRH